MSQPAENPAPAPAPESAPPAPTNPPSDLKALAAVVEQCDEWLNDYAPGGFMREALGHMRLARDMPDKWALDGIDRPLYLRLEALWHDARQIGTRCGALAELPALPKANCLLNEASNFAVALQNYANRLLEDRRAARLGASNPQPAGPVQEHAMSEPAEKPERLGIDPRLDDDLAEALSVARSAARATSNFIGTVEIPGIPLEGWKNLRKDMADLGPRLKAIDNVLADLVPVANPNTSFDASCAHKAALEYWMRTTLMFHAACGDDFERWKTVGALLAPKLDANALEVACERETYAAQRERSMRGPHAHRTAAPIPSEVREWLVARFLSAPSAVRLYEGAPRLALYPLDTFTDFLRERRLSVLPTLTECRNYGWIDDLLVCIIPSDNPTARLPQRLAELNLSVGNHRIVAIAETVLSATPSKRGRHSNARGTKGKSKNPRRKVGRPERTESDPVVYQENQLYRDWKASKLPQKEFLEARELNLAKYTRVLDRARKRLEKLRK